MKDKINSIQGHQWAALAIAVIVGLAEGVIVYELQLSGGWLVPDWLAWLKTIAFMLIFVSSLIAEMQNLAPRVRWLLIATVVILGLYQAFTNAWGNYYGANIPPQAVAFFNGALSPEQVRRGFAIVDALTRTAVVVLMWLVTGLVWRGVAVSVEVATAPQVELMAMQTDMERMRADLAAAQHKTETAKAEAQAAGAWKLLSGAAKARFIAENMNGNRPSAAEVARLEGTALSTISREYGKVGGKG